MSSSDFSANVEGKDRLRNDSLFLAVVKDGSGPSNREVWVAQAQDAIKGCIFEPVLFIA